LTASVDPPLKQQGSDRPTRRRGWVTRLVADTFFVAKRDKKWWILPLIVLLLILAALLALATLAGPLAPFIYPFL
jgi:hypothetical protein